MANKPTKRVKKPTPSPIWPDVPSKAQLQAFINGPRAPLVFTVLALLMPGLAWSIPHLGSSAWADPRIGYFIVVLGSLQLWPLTVGLLIAIIIILKKVKRKKGLIISALLLLVSISYCILLFSGMVPLDF